jgi:hypothetical protein
MGFKNIKRLFQERSQPTPFVRLRRKSRLDFKSIKKSAHILKKELYPDLTLARTLHYHSIYGMLCV